MNIIDIKMHGTKIKKTIKILMRIPYELPHECRLDSVSTSQYITVHHSTLQYITVHHSTSQYITVHYSSNSLKLFKTVQSVKSIYTQSKIRNLYLSM